MEFIVQTDLATALPAEIGFNFEELKTELAERLQYYNSLVVTEDAIKDAKTDRANLNKLRSAIDTRRKEIKKQYLKPLDEFEGKVKELLALIDQPIGAIDGQLATFEDTRKEGKRKEIEAAYATIVTDELADIIPLDRIFDQRWLNATMDMKKVEEAMKALVKRTRAELLVVESVEPEYAAAVRLKYKETLDFDAALKYRSAIKSAAEAEKQRQIQTPAEEPKQPTAAAREPKIAPAEHHDEKLYTLRLQFALTMNQANALKQFLAQNQIDYMKI